MVEENTDLGSLGDSMDIIDIIMGIEDKFNISIDDKNWNLTTTIGELVEIIKKEK